MPHARSSREKMRYAGFRRLFFGGSRFAKPSFLLNPVYWDDSAQVSTDLPGGRVDGIRFQLLYL